MTLAAAQTATPEVEPAQKEPTIQIGGQDVPVAQVAGHFDPNCPRRCREGAIRVGRPAPKPFRGVVTVTELCDCAVMGWRREHGTTEVAVGDVARAAAEAPAGDPASPAERPNPRADQVLRLRSSLAIERDAIAALAAREEAATCADREALSRSERFVYARNEIAGMIQEARTEFEATRDALEHLLEIANEEATAPADVLSRMQEAKKEFCPTRRVHERRAEKLERRIAAIIARHPEADGG